MSALITQIFSNKKNLSFTGNKLASIKDYKTANREGFVVKSLKSHDRIELKEGIFTLDDNLDLL